MVFWRFIYLTWEIRISRLSLSIKLAYLKELKLHLFPSFTDVSKMTHLLGILRMNNLNANPWISFKIMSFFHFQHSVMMNRWNVSGDSSVSTMFPQLPDASGITSLQRSLILIHWTLDKKINLRNLFAKAFRAEKLDVGAGLGTRWANSCRLAFSTRCSGLTAPR